MTHHATIDVCLSIERDEILHLLLEMVDRKREWSRTE